MATTRVEPAPALTELATDSLEHAVDVVHTHYYDNHLATWSNTRWLGQRVQKMPTDLWIYQEILAEIRPVTIVETGSNEGGSALFLASICDLLHHGRVVSIDIQPPPAIEHPRITWFTGSSVAPDIVERVHQFVRRQGEGPVLVILDSDHSRDHVLREMLDYAPLVTPGSYLIVEDTNINGHPVLPEFGPGPAEAIEAFLPGHPEFTVDKLREKFYLTFNGGGYLRRQ